MTKRRQEAHEVGALDQGGPPASGDGAVGGVLVPGGGYYWHEYLAQLYQQRPELAAGTRTGQAD